MKKITLTTITAILGILLFSSSALAATTASLAPNSVKVIPGQKFSIAISVNPQGTANYAEKLEITYPADTLEVSSFTLGSNWMAMTQPGYDSTDNANGILIKTAGYPGGISTLTPFGTVTFSAKKAGNGIIKIGGNSVAFQASSQSTISGNSASFAITAPVVIPKITPKAIVPSIPTVTEQEIETATTSSEQEVESSQVAAVTSAVPETTGSAWTWILSIVVILLIIYGIYTVIKRQNK
ncbi:MAG TPA: hypothetical protein VJJ28_02565 [Candidatus Paceibacterota bacterium]